MLLGISGKIGSGKTTIAENLEKHYKFKRMAFGDNLKKECSDIFKFPLEWAYDQEKKLNKIDIPKYIQKMYSSKSEMTIREILQWWGTDIRRKQDSLYWVKSLMNDLITQSVNSERIVVDDVRFLSEIESLKHAGAKLIRINTYKEWKPGENANHLSEIALDDYKNFDVELTPGFGELEDYTHLIMKLKFK